MILKNKNQGLFLAMLFGLFTFFFITNTAQALLIDDFSSSDQFVTAGQGGGASNTFSSASSIGGFRTLELPSPSGNPVVGPFFVSLNVITAQQVLGYGSDAGTSGSGSVTWDAAGAGLGGVDVTEGGINDVFALDLGFFSPGMDILVELIDTSGNLASISSALIAQFSVLELTLDSFTNAGATDYTSIDSIRLQMQGGEGDSAEFNSVSITTSAVAVPEPSTVTLMGLGLAGIGFARKKKKA